MIDRNEIETLQAALAHEERARSWYDREAEARKGTPAGALFDFLAAEEAGHIRKLSARFEIPETEATWDHRFLPSLIDLERIAREVEETETDPLRRALSVAKTAEERAVEFYGTAAETVSDRNTRGLLLALLEEERAHLARIEEFRKKV